MRVSFTSLCAVLAVFSLTACGTLTGIPSHGGGKRYAIEQELIASSSRAAIKSLDVSALKGRRIVLRMVTIGDQGAGNLMGGRYTIDGLLRGEFLNTPTTTTTNDYPTVSTSTTTTGGGFDTVTIAENALNAPSRSITKSDGTVSSIGAGVRYQGLGNYDNSTLITNTGDTQYLLNLLQTYFYLQGVDIVGDPSRADTAVFVTVDVFGTVRSREDWHLLNQENLVARTSLELMAVDLTNGASLISPVSASYEAKYAEKYALWSGPYAITTDVNPSRPLPVTFEDLHAEGHKTDVSLSVGLLSNDEQSKPQSAFAHDPREVKALEQSAR